MNFNFAKYEESERLQRALALMLDGCQRTTREIDRGADVCAVNSVAAELRANGFDFICIRRSRPAMYQLFNVDQAKLLSDTLLKKAA
jgi:hypothetical protein